MMLRTTKGWFTPGKPSWLTLSDGQHAEAVFKTGSLLNGKNDRSSVRLFCKIFTI